MKTKDMIKLSYVLIGTLLLFLAGCSDDDEIDDHFTTEWLQCAPGCFVMRFEGLDTINEKAVTTSLGSNVIAIATFVQMPKYDDKYHYPPGGNLIFNPSDLPDEEFKHWKMFVCSISDVRHIKMKGPYHFQNCIGKLKPYKSDLTVHDVHGTIQTGQYHPDTWTIVYEEDGQQNLLIPIDLDDSMKREGLEVVFSGELIEYNGSWFINDPDIPEEKFDKIYRIKLADISPQ